MYSQKLESSLLEIASGLLEQSRAGRVNWQTVGGEPANYYVHFGDATSFIVSVTSSDDGDTTAILSLKIGSAIAVRMPAKESEENFALFKEVFDEAHRAATGWDEAIKRIQDQIASGESLGDPAGDIPL